MTWKSPPLHRHLATVGIGPVFISPPPHPPLPHRPPTRDGQPNRTEDGDDVECKSNGGDVDDQAAAVVTTWEIVGDIKSAPEDFVVREIGWAPAAAASTARNGGDGFVESGERDIEYRTNVYRRRPGWTRRIAGLETDEDDVNAEDTDAPATATPAAERGRTAAEADHTLAPNTSPKEVVTQSIQSDPNADSVSGSKEEEDLDSRTDMNPLDGLRRILSEHCQADGSSADSILQQLTSLQRSGMEDIDKKHSATDDSRSKFAREKVWIPTAPELPGTEDWKLLHQHTRKSFSLLQTETSSSAGPPDEECGSDAKRLSVCAFIDYTFFQLVPYLSNPREDLPLLYKFRNDGPCESRKRSRSNNGRRSNSRKGGKRKAEGQRPADGEKKDSSKDDNHNSSQGFILLRLKPDLPRSERRVIHQILSSSRRRDFETSTEHSVPLDYDDKQSKRTTAILVQWSFNAIKSINRKRKRGDGGKGEMKPSIDATFCVLRKHQCEHQVAAQQVARALRCRPGDVGLAGIKDMQAITYQFCTLRNVDSSRAQRVSNNIMGNRIQLSNFVDVRGFMLDRGKLLGNRFEITLRNLKRIQRCVKGDGSSKERTVPVDAPHIDAMVKRIRDLGFINFYGEQRVGDAGDTSYVGVRSFDVGRAMLKGDFPLAVDLIMTGRSHQVYSPEPEEKHAREVWKSSGGDARATLKAFPKNECAMVRERDIMKGLLRYANHLEAIRCVPHNARMFWLHGYQSFIWNRAVTERIRRHGLHPIVGDLYIQEIDGSSGDKDDANVNVHVVDDPGKVDISQIVLPLPGYNISYPSNEIGELYKEMLRDDGIELSKDSVAESTCKGSYRKIIQKATNLKWNSVSEGEDNSDGPTVSAARVSFELESGCYATMMLRELMVTTLSRCSSKESQKNT